MSPVTEAASRRHRGEGVRFLAKDALGLPQVLFCIVTGAAPLAAMMFNVPVAVSGGGYAVPAAFIVATVALTIFSTRLHRDVEAGDGDRRLLHVHLARPRSCPRDGLRRADRLLLHHLRGGRDGRRQLLRVDVDRGLDRRGDSRVGLPDPVPGDDDRVRLVPHRTDRQDPRRGAYRRGAGAAGDERRHHRQRRRPGRLQRGSAESGQPLRQRGRDRGVRGGGGRDRPVRRLLVVGRLRDGAQLRGRVPRAAQDRQDRDLHVGHRPRRLLRLRLVHVRVRMGPDRLRAGRRGPVRGQLRVRVLPADGQVRRLRPDDDGRDPDHHELVRLLDGVLQHRLALPVLAGP